MRSGVVGGTTCAAAEIVPTPQATTRKANSRLRTAGLFVCSIVLQFIAFILQFSVLRSVEIVYTHD